MRNMEVDLSPLPLLLPSPDMPTLDLPGSAVATAQATDAWPKKSPFTCTTCRARKVRCNGARPHCSNCQRLALPCYYDPTGSDHWNINLPRRRVRQACLSCHSRKAKCSGHVPSCERCRKQGLECIYKTQKRYSAGRLSVDLSTLATGPSGAAGSHDESDAADTDSVEGQGNMNIDTDGPPKIESFSSIVEKTMDQFFRHVHHIPMFSFFHRASLMEEYHAGKMDKALLLALIGITSCFMDMGPGMKEYGDRCIDEAECRILSEYTVPSTIKVQALVLIIKHRILSNRFPSAFMLYSTASRFATVLRLSHESPQLCFLAQESRRRLMWSLYCLDIAISGGFEEFSLWRADRINVGLPCNERNFEFDLSQPTERLIPDPSEGSPKPHAEGVASLALHVRILYLRQKVNEFTKSALVSRRAAAVDLQAGINSLQQELGDFAARLPASFQFSDNSLRLRAYSPRICIFIMIHVWWHQCHCDLYRLALTGFRDALPPSTFESFDPQFLQQCQKRCVEHASSMAGIFSKLQKLGAKPVADLELAVCASQCAQMLYYAYRLKPNELGISAEAVIEHANACLEAIKQCCRGTAARMIQEDLARSIARGINFESSSPLILSQVPDQSSQIGSLPSLALPAHPVLRDIQVGDEPAVLGSPIHKGSPSPSTAQNSMTRPSSPWPADSTVLQQTVLAGPSDLLPGNKQRETVSYGEQNATNTQGELSNAYEGALEGLGLDNGLDFAMGIFDTSRMWLSPNLEWMGQPDSNI